MWFERVALFFFTFSPLALLYAEQCRALREQRNWEALFALMEDVLRQNQLLVRENEQLRDGEGWKRGEA